MALIQRLKAWWNQPTQAEQYLEDKVIVDVQRWDGYPSNAEECRRSYKTPEITLVLNVNCTACGDPITSHDITVPDDD